MPKSHMVCVLLPTQNWLPWQRPLRNRKTEPEPDQENSRKYLPFCEKIVKIGLVDTEIALLIVKEIKKKNKKLEMRGKATHIARSAPQCRPPSK